MKRISIFFLIATLGISCNKYFCPETVYCTAGYNFVLVGFDTASIDTVVFRVYASGNNFTTPLDTALIADTFVGNTFNGPQYVWWNISQKYDTLLNGSMQLLNYRIFDADTSYISYDWEIYIPKANRTYRIAGITMSGNTSQKMSGCDQDGDALNPSCSQYVSAYSVNGTTYHRNDNKDGEPNNFIYLQH